MIYSYFKAVLKTVFSAVKGNAAFSFRYVKGVPLVSRRYTQEVPFLPKMAYKRVRGWNSGHTPNANMADLSAGPGLVAQKRG